MHWPTHLQETAQHLVWMAQIPGAQDHAKQRRDELLADPLYEGLRELIVAENVRVRALSSPSAQSQDSTPANTGEQGHGA